MKRLLIALSVIVAISSCKKTSSTPTTTDTTVSVADVSKVFTAGSSSVTTEVNIASSNMQAPSQSSGQTWNWSNIVFYDTTNTTTYSAAASPFPSSAFYFSFKNASLVSSDSIPETTVFNVSDSGNSELGHVLSATTLTIPGLGTIAYSQQNEVFTSGLPETPMLPFKFGDAVTFSNIISYENFVANAPGVGLNNVPGQQGFTSSGSATAWAEGKLTLKGYSSPLTVVVVKVHINTITNYYLGGAPAPAQLLAMLGLTDGAASSSDWYDFYNPGGFGYIGTINVDESNTVKGAWFHQP